MKLQGKCWRKAALAAVALGGLLVLLGFFFPAQLLCIDNAPAQADFLVVLGGGSELRAAHAAQLYKNGVAPRILVTGDGERAVGKRALLAAGVANESINTEWDSKNTRQNAEFSAKLLR